jgi:hypothetical protein
LNSEPERPFPNAAESLTSIEDRHGVDTAILAACNMFRAAATYLIQQRGTEYFLDEVEAAIAEQPHRSTAIWEAAKRRVLRAALVILDGSPDGAPEGTMYLLGIDQDTLADLVTKGFAERQVVKLDTPSMVFTITERGRAQLKSAD